MNEKNLILEKIQKKESEIQSLEEKLRAAKVYIQALKDVLCVFPSDGGQTPLLKTEPILRPGSAMALAREAILQEGRPIHVDDLLLAIGKEVTKESRSSLGSAIAAYVRRGEVFTRPAPNTFGLLELTHFADEDAYEPPPDFGGMPNGAANYAKKGSFEA
jgi:hypothetical protein